MNVKASMLEPDVTNEVCIACASYFMFLVPVDPEHHNNYYDKLKNSLRSNPYNYSSHELCCLSGALHGLNSKPYSGYFR